MIPLTPLFQALWIEKHFQLDQETSFVVVQSYQPFIPPLCCDIRIDALGFEERNHAREIKSSYHEITFSFYVILAIGINKSVILAFDAGAHLNLDSRQCFSATHPLKDAYGCIQFRLSNFIPRSFQIFTQHQRQSRALRKTAAAGYFFCPGGKGECAYS